jgi:hypothetical protein
MKNQTLHTHVVLDRPYQVRFGFAAKQRMSKLKGAFTPQDMMDEAKAEAATVAWIWACLDCKHPFEDDFALGRVWETLSEEVQLEAIKQLHECIRLGLPKPKDQKDPNASAESSLSPALNSA